MSQCHDACVGVSPSDLTRGSSFTPLGAAGTATQEGSGLGPIYLGSSEWKRRGERLVRASGNDYTIVRPGWFDYNDADELRIAPRQDDTEISGTPADGVVDRHEIARVLVDSLTNGAAVRKTFELVAARGTEQDDLRPVFDALQADQIGSFDGVLDTDNLPLHQELTAVLDALDHARSRS